jgi:succinoglycan biosynthesis transport protein ExoP
MEPPNHSLPPARPVDLVPRPPVVNAPYYPTAYVPDTPDPSDSEGGLLDYWRMICRHKTAIILTSLAGLLIGFAVGIPMTPIYRARTSIEVLNLNEDFMNLKRTNPVSTNDSSYDVSEAETQTKLLQSDSLLKRVIEKMDPAAAQPARNPKMATSGWRNWMHLPEPAQLPDRQKLLGRIVGTLRVKATVHTRIIEATVESPNPRLAADFANTLVEEFIQQNLEARFATTHRTSDWLTREIDAARTNLRTSEDALQAYARSSGLIFTDETNNVATEKLQQYQQQLSAATADRIAKQARFELAKNSPPDSVADVINDAGLKETSSKVNDLRRQVAELTTVYNPEFGKVKQAQAELTVYETVFERNRADILKRIENDFTEATSREKLLASAYDVQTREVTGQDEKAIQYNILKREVDSNRQLYDTMLQQTKESSIASALHASNVRLVDPAEIPDTPFSPNFRINSAIGLMAGLILSITLITIRERADRTLQQPGDIKLWTDLAELGNIPSAGAFVKNHYARPSLANPETGRNGNVPHTVEMVTWQEKPSFIAEAFRSTLTSILFVGENGSRPRVLVVTSPHPGDGKTTVASNLAIAIAEIRRKVLVIDGDLRRPCMQGIFGVTSDRGLSDLLREDFSEAETAALIQPTNIPYLDVLAAGPATHAATHLLHSSKFAALLVKLKKEYDMILIDTPPMLPMADARVAGRLADAVILVARSGQTTRDAVLAAKERLADDSIRLLGTVLNDWDPKNSPGGYYGQYQYKYYGKYPYQDKT